MPDSFADGYCRQLLPTAVANAAGVAGAAGPAVVARRPCANRPATPEHPARRRHYIYRTYYRGTIPHHIAISPYRHIAISLYHHIATKKFSKKNCFISLHIQKKVVPLQRN